MRKDGYYWIWMNAVNGWEVAYYDGTADHESNRGWYSIWDGGVYKEHEVRQVGERLVREGKSKSVTLPEVDKDRIEKFNK